MQPLIEGLLMVGTLIAGGAVGVVCGLGFLVWAAGRRKPLFKAKCS